MLRQDHATADARTRERGLADIVARVKRMQSPSEGGDVESVQRLARALSVPVAELRRAWAAAHV